jgi:DNA-binding CsgD family transcriptional regulator
MNHPAPYIAIVESNTLAALGLKGLLSTVVPFAQIDLFGTMAELTAAAPSRYIHYFVAMNIVLENRQFFTSCRQRTIVLSPTTDTAKQLSDFNSICVNVPEKELVRSLLALQQRGHKGGKNMPPHFANEPRQLSDREAEVMVLIVKGYINKEIADLLNIGLSTVVTHRKNIMEKLGVKSVSALTIYAVVNGYVDIDKI